MQNKTKLFIHTCPCFPCWFQSSPYLTCRPHLHTKIGPTSHWPTGQPPRKAPLLTLSAGNHATGPTICGSRHVAPIRPGRRTSPTFPIRVAFPLSSSSPESPIPRSSSLPWISSSRPAHLPAHGSSHPSPLTRGPRRLPLLRTTQLRGFQEGEGRIARIFDAR